MAKKNQKKIFSRADVREKVSLRFEEGITLSSNKLELSVCVHEKDSTSKKLQLMVNILGERQEGHDADDDLEVVLRFEDMLPIADVLQEHVLDFVSFSDVGFDHDWSERLTVAMDAFLNTMGTLRFARVGPDAAPCVEFRLGDLTTVAFIEEHEAAEFLTLTDSSEAEENDDGNPRSSEEVDEGPSL